MVNIKPALLPLGFTVLWVHNPYLFSFKSVILKWWSNVLKSESLLFYTFLPSWIHHFCKYYLILLKLPPEFYHILPHSLSIFKPLIWQCQNLRLSFTFFLCILIISHSQKVTLATSTTTACSSYFLSTLSTFMVLTTSHKFSFHCRLWSHLKTLDSSVAFQWL